MKWIEIRTDDKIEIKLLRDLCDRYDITYKVFELKNKEDEE